MNEQLRFVPKQVERVSHANAPTLQSPRKRHLLRWAVGMLVLIGLIGGVAYWMMREQALPQYTTAAISRGPVTRAVSASGTVNPVLTVIVGSYISGVIQTVSCDFNSKVKKGQLCAKIDGRPYESIVAQAFANLANAKAQLVKDQANLAYAKTSNERNSKLFVIGGVSQDQAELARNAYDQALAQVALDEATIKQREAALEAAQVNLEYTNIYSPVDGVVVSRNVTIGQTVAASFQTPTLFLIATDLTKMEVDANVGEGDIGAIKNGDNATFTVESYPGRIFHGVVTQVRQSPQTVQNVVTYDVVVTFDNKDLLLKPGMTATTRIITAEREDVLRVPDQALRFSPGGLERTASAQQTSPRARSTQPVMPQAEGRVWVMTEDELREVPLKLGLDDDTFTEVVSGDLKEDDQVVTAVASVTTNSPTAVPRLRF
jgi:HlyD family secretion protein